MFSRIEVRNFRCLRSVAVDLKPFQVLVGPNGSGKSTLFDVLRFVGALTRGETVDEALLKIGAERFEDVLWKGAPDDGYGAQDRRCIAVAVEARLPESRCNANGYDTIRYGVVVERGVFDKGALSTRKELVELFTAAPLRTFPRLGSDLADDLATSRVKGTKPRPILKRNEARNGLFYPSSGASRRDFEMVKFRGLVREKSAFSQLPEDEEKFGPAVWFKGLLTETVQLLDIQSHAIRRPTPRNALHATDGGALPWQLHALNAKEHVKDYNEWRAHLQTVLRDVKSLRTRVREDDGTRYVEVTYANGAKVPSWALSHGTLRVLALTILPYLPDNRHAYLVEEPENGLHPQAIQAVLDSLRSVYDGQVMVTTHSPVVLANVRPDEVLCFSKLETGEARIIPGSEHPTLKDWKGGVSLGSLFAAGVLE